MDGLVDALSQLLAESVAIHCAVCGSKLTPDDSKYCSDKCRQKVMMQNMVNLRDVVLSAVPLFHHGRGSIVAENVGFPLGQHAGEDRIANRRAWQKNRQDN